MAPQFQIYISHLIFLFSCTLTSCDTTFHQKKLQNNIILLSYEKLSTKSPEELRLIRNEIFARKGYPFKSPDLIEHFLKKSWYNPSPDSINVRLSERENKYVEHILKLEKGLKI